MFKIGDKVAHPMHGAGVIDDIVQEKVGDTLRTYYVFRMPLDALVLKIPAENSDAIGIRPVVARQEAERILQALPQLSCEECVNWNQRNRENLQRIKSGDLYEVARVMKGLLLREAGHGLSTGERRTLYLAKQIFLSELVLSEDADYDGMEQAVSQAMIGGLA